MQTKEFSSDLLDPLLLKAIVFNKKSIALLLLESPKISLDALKAIYDNGFVTDTDIWKKAEDILRINAPSLIDDDDVLRSKSPMSPLRILVAFLEWPESIEWLKLALKQTKDPIMAISSRVFELNYLYKSFLEKKLKPFSSISKEEFLGTLLAFKHLNVDGAESELSYMKEEHPDLFLNFNDATFMDTLKSTLFDSLRISRSFNHNRWKGFVNPRGLQTSQIYSRPYHSLPFTKEFEVIVQGQARKLSYITGGMDSSPFIVVSVYTGSNKDMCVTVDPFFFSKPVLSIGLNLWDCSTDIRFNEQLRPKQFQSTHAAYIFAVSEFIKHLKTLYPSKKIYLHGASFGGFFVTSYALLQSVFTNKISMDKVYEEFAADSFRSFFPDEKIGLIEGFFGQASALYFVRDILNSAIQPLQYLSIPAFYTFNYDDDRVKRISYMGILETAPEGMVELFVNREGAQYYGKEPEQDNNNAVSTLRGHFYSHDPFIEGAMIDFMERVAQGKLMSPLKESIHKRRIKIYTSYHPDIMQKDVEQYLSNLTRMQRTLKKKNEGKKDSFYRMNEDEQDTYSFERLDDPYFKAIIDKAIIDLSFKDGRFLEGFKNINLYADIYGAHIKMYNKSPSLDYKMLLTLLAKVREESPLAFENFVSSYPGLKELYEKQRKVFLEKIRAHTSTRDIWKKAKDRILLKQAITKVKSAHKAR